MKVALIHYRLVNRGGLETRLINYSNYFVNRGDDVTIICAKYAEDVAISDKVKIEKINLGIVPNPFRKMNFAVQVSKYMSKHTFDFSLSLSRTFSQDAVLAPGNHLGYLIANNKSYKSIDDRLQIYLDRQAFKNTPIIFAASEFMKEELLELYGIEEEKIAILYPPINTQDFKILSSQEQIQLKKKYQINPNTVNFVFASSGHKRKGIDLLLDIFKELDPDRFHLYIAGYPKVKTDLKNVRNLGFCKKMMEVYNAADYTIHPAIYEPFGQIIAESILCGTPVIVSQKVGAKSIVNDSNGIVLPNFNKETWIDCIAGLGKSQFPNIHNSLSASLSTESHMEIMLASLR